MTTRCPLCGRSSVLGYDAGLLEAYKKYVRDLQAYQRSLTVSPKILRHYQDPTNTKDLV